MDCIATRLGPSCVCLESMRLKILRQKIHKKSPAHHAGLEWVNNDPLIERGAAEAAGAAEAIHI